MRSLSKSTTIMFMFDFVILGLSTLYFSESFGFSQIAKFIALILVVISGLITLFLKGYYKIREFNVTYWNIYRLAEGVIFMHVPCGLVLFFLINKIIMLKFIGFNMVAIFLGLLIYRLCFHFYLFHIKRIKNILIIGTGKDAKLIAEEIGNKYALKMNVVGFLEDEIVQEHSAIDSNCAKVFSNDCDLRQIIKENNVNIVIVAIKRRMENSLLTKMIFKIPRHVKLYKMADFYEMLTGKYYIDRMTVNWLFYDFMNNRSYVYDFCKRVFDIVSALIILTVTLPITLYTAIRVKLTDGGNPIYTQMRIGRGGKHFKCYKLRTMYKNDYVPKDVKVHGYADNQDDDDRVIPFCKFVRKARFDEIPQMINILKGDMSIVGPRTEWEDLVKLYSEQVPYYPCRMWVRTGWTGWAQINQGHCITNDDIFEKLQYDLYYLKHRNIFWELAILVKAVFLALGGRHD